MHECVCAWGKHHGLPHPELVRRQHYNQNEASDQRLTDEESDSELPSSITQPLEAAPPPDSSAGGWGIFKSYSRPWRAQEHGLEWLQEPEAALHDHSQSLRHFCACEVGEFCDHCCPRPCEVPQSQQKQDPLQGRAQASTSLVSSKLRARSSEQCNKLHLSARQPRVKLRKRVRQQAPYMYASGQQMLFPGVRDEILNLAGLRESKFIDTFASKQRALFSKYWDEKVNALVQDWSYDTPEKGDHTDYFLWVHCPQFSLQQSVEKILLDQGRSIMLLPVQKHQSWFWQMGDVALDWWDLHPRLPIYSDNSGIIYKQSTKWTTRVVLFDALGLKDSEFQDKRWEDESGPVAEGEHRHLKCAQACGQCEQCSRADLRVISDRGTTDMPPLSDGSSDEEGSHAVLPSRGRKYRRFARKGKRELLRRLHDVKTGTFVGIAPRFP